MMGTIRVRVNKARKNYQTAKGETANKQAASDSAQSGVNSAQSAVSSNQSNADTYYGEYTKMADFAASLPSTYMFRDAAIKARDEAYNRYQSAASGVSASQTTLSNAQSIARDAQGSLLTAQTNEGSAKKQVGRWTNEAKRQQAAQNPELVGTGQTEAQIEQEKKRKKSGKTVLTGSLGIQDEATIRKSLLGRVS